MSNLILPSNQIIKPATLSRRGFLRSLGVTTAVVMVPGLRISRDNFDHIYNQCIADHSVYSKVEFSEHWVTRTKFYSLDPNQTFKFLTMRSDLIE